MSNDESRMAQLQFKQDINEGSVASESNAYETGVTMHCEKHGDYQEKAYDLFGRVIKLSYCMTCLSEKNAAEAKELEELKAKKELERYAASQKRAGVSPRNAAVRFKDYVSSTSDQQYVYDSVHGFAKGIHEGRQVPNLILTGKVGTGKTMLANCTINALFKSKRVKVIKLQDMLRKIKGSYQQGANYTEEEAIENYASYDLLILDEVGVSRDTDNDKILIFDVLDGRYQNMLPTMIISNLNIEGIKDTLGERVVDRLRDGGGILLGCDWESHRK